MHDLLSQPRPDVGELHSFKIDTERATTHLKNAWSANDDFGRLIALNDFGVDLDDKWGSADGER